LDQEIRGSEVAPCLVSPVRSVFVSVEKCSDLVLPCARPPRTLVVYRDGSDLHGLQTGGPSMD
jgi:hypothetical protein